jgi:hypothetical protein
MADTATIIDAMLAVRPELRVMLSSYDYPNFNVGFWCFLSACPMRRNLSRDPDNDLVTDAELNAMLVQVEQRRIDLANTNPRIFYDNSLGLMHAVYGDGVSGPGVLPRPGHEPPSYEPFPAGNPLRPSLRSVFRLPNGLDADPIHLDVEGYQYKIAEQSRAWFFPHFRDNPSATLFSLGGDADGWTDGVATGTADVRVGDTGSARVAGLVTFDTSALPEGAMITRAALYLHRASVSGGNPFASGALGTPRLDLARGHFGAAAIETSDLDAPADASNIGIAYGSVATNRAVVRFELDAAGLAAIETGGTTQFRIAFPNVGGAAGADLVVFHDGDVGLPPNTGLPTAADFIGSAAPLLDVYYEVPTDVAAAGRGAAQALTWPNPFTFSTTIRFTVRAPGDVDVSVFDVAGRRVVRLLGTSLPRGRHELTWDGRDSRGARVPAGVYMARMSDRVGQETVRLVVLEP